MRKKQTCPVEIITGSRMSCLERGQRNSEGQDKEQSSSLNDVVLFNLTSFKAERSSFALSMVSTKFEQDELEFDTKSLLLLLLLLKLL